VRLEPGVGDSLQRYLDRLARAKASVSSVTDSRPAWNVHVADSLSGLEVAELRSAVRIADLGAGAGFPGVALAAAVPTARVDLIESVRRKCEFMSEAIAASGLQNASVLCCRSEELAAAEGREAYDAVVARAVGSLATVAELASPLLRVGGILVAWRGSRDRAVERRLAAAQDALAMRQEQVLAVTPYAGSRDRNLHLVRKLGPTPSQLPRRPGMARKRPLGGR
jgi:16S rRNA (guanine527-N7)-methyltransferase